MRYRYIPLGIKLRLWAKAAGRCEYLGCNDQLWRDAKTQKELNKAYIAHIIADSPDGPRGDVNRSEQLKFDLSNLMLLCDAHHRLIDKEDVAGHSEERLQEMKRRHEYRVEISSGVDAERMSHVVLYGANIGHHAAVVSMEAATRAMLPEWYPAEPQPITLGMRNAAWDDRTEAFWVGEAANLRALVDERLRPRLKTGAIEHLSIFAIAPQPLLMLFGRLLTDIPRAEVYQLHREPMPGWAWAPNEGGSEFLIDRPVDAAGKTPALVFAISGPVARERITAVLPDAAIWHVHVALPHNDFLRSRNQLSAFRAVVRALMEEIKYVHGEGAQLHVFPAMPVAMAVDFGRVIMPKARLPITVYDQNQALGGFAPALDLSLPTERSRT
jgi:hypothetical protein